MATKGILLLNLGTPEEPTAKGLRKFYKYFFSDPYVFDFNAVGRWLLRNLIIIPFEHRKRRKTTRRFDGRRLTAKGLRRPPAP